jgi:hypothetical protein
MIEIQISPIERLDRYTLEELILRKTDDTPRNPACYRCHESGVELAVMRGRLLCKPCRAFTALGVR